MSLEPATVKPEANFPAAHPYWAGLLLGVATIPVFIALTKPVAQHWDLFHHHHGPYAHTPHWYIPFCVVYDWIVGAFLLVWWW